jgi:endonuclease YncB( thermonuclease family)
MTKRALTLAIVPKTYAELRDAVLTVVIKGRRAIDLAWVESYHEIGRLIHVHLLFKKERATYGAGVFSDLANESGISSRTLHECVQFQTYFPIVRRAAQLNWNHYRVLCQVPDPARRKMLLHQAISLDWHSKRLEAEVRSLALTDSPLEIGTGALSAHKPLIPQRGTPGLHLIVDRGDGLAVDLGFKLYWPLNPEQAKRFAKGDIVRIASDDSLRRADDATKADLFTYAATLRRVVDGDTLVVALEVSPGVFIEQKLRLRGLDCPEMKTPEGKVAKQFVDALVAKTTAVIINTTKSDKYDRYLADVFLTTDFGEVYLNNSLLENGQAVRKDAWEFGDWEPELR